MPFARPRPWQPLSDAEWAALRPHLRAEDKPGRKLADPRARMDAMLHMAVSGQPWHLLPDRWGKGDTVARHFRRLAHGGLWLRLLEALADPDCPNPLKAIEYWLLRAIRRAMRILQMAGIVLARRLKLYTALPMIPWMMPDPDLCDLVHDAVRRVLDHTPWRWPPKGFLRAAGQVLRVAGGRPVWSKRFAPP